MASSFLTSRNRLHTNEFSAYDLLHQELRDSVADSNIKRLVGCVDQSDHNLAPIASIDGTRRIENSYAVFESEPGTWMNQGNVSRRKRY
jgi:hypothetical protein